jgi:hypothetical protein
MSIYIGEILFRIPILDRCPRSNTTIIFFSISGNPLRALVTLTITEVNATIDRTFQSPDITKIPVIKDKDNIVKISKDSYDDQKYYIRIAEINNLSSVRELKKGSSIVLPPIKK